MDLLAVLLVAFVPVIALAVSLSHYRSLKWKFRELLSENRSLLRSLKNRHEKSDLLHSQIQDLSKRLMYRDHDFDSLLSDYQELKQQLENQPEPSAYQTQLQLKNQGLLAQVQRLQFQNQELKAQLGYQQRLGNPQVQELLAKPHCSNQGVHRSDCC